MDWDIELDLLTNCYQLIIVATGKVYDLEAEDYESALDEAAAILGSIGFYEEV